MRSLELLLFAKYVYDDLKKIADLMNQLPSSAMETFLTGEEIIVGHG